MFQPEGVYVAMITPFDQNGRVNEDVLRQITEFAINAGVDGLFPVSSVGEAVHLSFEEKIRSMQIVADQAQGRVKITPGVGSSYSGEAILLAENAAKAGCDAVVIAPPYFYQMSQEMVENYFETIIDASPLPSILYNIPLFTQPIDYDVVKRLSRRKTPAEAWWIWFISWTKLKSQVKKPFFLPEGKKLFSLASWPALKAV